MTAPIVRNEVAPTEVRPGVGEGAGGSKSNPQTGQTQCIKVAVRLRPLPDEMDGSQHKPIVNNVDRRAWSIEKAGNMYALVQKGAARKVDGRTIFHFDQVFDEDTKTPLLYKSIARPMVKNVLNGKHATIFAYGQTGSGKTYTMQGDGKSTSGQAGIIQLVASDLFRFMRQGDAAHREFIVKVSYFEIYNEKIRDLISDDEGSNVSVGVDKRNVSSSSVGSQGEDVKIRTNANGEIVVNVTQIEVSTVNEVLELLIQGNTQRVVAATDMNAHSSRSHAVFRLTVESRDPNEPVHLDSPVPEILRISDFNLVDLAGSESLKLTNSNTVARQREGANINKSLLALTNVVQSLSMPPKKRPKHINYRDSKLTRILQPHLSGNAEMAILCCACPSKKFVEETRSTLKFADRAKLVMMKPKVNEIMDDSATIKKLQHELMEARKMIDQLKMQQQQSTGIRSTSSNGDSSDDASLGGYENMNENLGGNGRVYDIPKKNQEQGNAHRERYDEGGYDYYRENQKSGTYGSSNRGQNHESISQEEMNELFRHSDHNTSHSSDGSVDYRNLNSSQAGFQLDAADPRVARKTLSRYMKGDTYSVDSADLLTISGSNLTDDDDNDKIESKINKLSGNKQKVQIPTRDRTGTSQRNKITAGAEEETETIDGPEASFSDVSRRFGGPASLPDTIRRESGEKTIKSTCLSWDTMDLNTLRPQQIGQPLWALQSLTARDAPIPEEVIIANAVAANETTTCLVDQLKDAENRIKFLEHKLESSNELIEATFKDLERARLCIHDLVLRNVEMKGKTKRKRRKEEYEQGEILLEQYWILKGFIYLGLFFFLSGGHEMFLASVFFVWLSLETNLTA